MQNYSYFNNNNSNNSNDDDILNDRKLNSRSDGLLRDKSNLHENANTRLNNRDLVDIQLNKNRRSNRYHNVNRMDIERDEFLKNSNQFNNTDDNINQVDNSELLRGMPLRSNYNMKEDMYNNNLNQSNLNQSNLNQSNLNQFSLNPDNFTSNNINLDSYETNKNNLADINANTQLTTQLKNKNVCSEGINILGIFMFNNLSKLLDMPFVVNNFGLYNVFVPIYLGSKGNTEIELKNYFLYPKRNVLQEGILELHNIMNKLTYIKTDSCILLNDQLEFNPDYCSYISNITKIRAFDPTNSNQEVEKINNIISNTLGISMKKSINNISLNNSLVNLLNYTYIKPQWFHPFNKKLVDIFIYRNKSQIKQEYMQCDNDLFGYFEDQNVQIIELKCEGINLVMGILLSKDNFIIDDKQLNFYIRNIKPTQFNKVIIPIFKIQTKLRFNSFLQQTNLKTVFLDLNVPEMFKDDNAKLSDVIQNLELNININENINNNNNKYKSNRSFIANRSFMFYFRIPDINMIPFIGYY